jgi:alanine racemase
MYDSMLREGIHPGLRHAANSAAALRLPESRLDAVRLGTLLYGQYPSKFVPRMDGLDPQTWCARARVVFVRDLPSGASIGYGAEVTLRKPTRAAVIAVGFADGFGMAPASLFHGRRGVGAVLRHDRPFVVLHGATAPVLGRIAMQMVVVDVSQSPKTVEAGDIAEIPVRRLAASSRLPRVYHRDR